MKYVYFGLGAIFFFAGISSYRCQDICPCEVFDVIESECKNTDAQLTCLPNEEIIGGDPANINDWPYIISLQFKVVKKGVECYSHFCGGALISPYVILTAAHCFRSFFPGNKGVPHFNVYVAQAPPCRHLYNSRGVVGYRSKVEMIELHPEFYQVRGPSGDVAVVVVNTSLPGPYVQLESEYTNPISRTSITMAGYGAINPVEKDNPQLYNMRQLYQANVFYQNEILCNFSLDNYDRRVNNTAGQSSSAFNSTSMICGYNQRLDSCKGDSGGPAVRKGAEPSLDVMVGVMSWGPARQCISEVQGQAPAIFTRISTYYEWIMEKVAEYSGVGVIDNSDVVILDPFANTTDVVYNIVTP